MAGTRTATIVRTALARLRHQEGGMTIVEGVVAMLLLITGALGALQVFDTATRNTYRSEQSQVVVNRLQSELEKIAALPYAQVAMTSNPGTSSDPKDPRSQVSGTNFTVGGTARAMVLNGGSLPGGSTISEGVVSPGPVAFTSGDVSGRIYRFVTWMPDPSCAACGTQSVKRVIVAAKVDTVGSSFARSYQQLQTNVSDPEVAPQSNPAPPDTGNDHAVAEFWLTDTTCNNSSRQPIVADHATHNTRGVCTNNLQTGNTVGAPDLMFTEAPALDPDYPPAGQPLFDYATDVEPVQNPTLDKGALIRQATTNGCLLSGTLLDLPLLESNKQTKLHKWLSEPIPTGGNVLMLGHATLQLWTRSVNGASHPGKICVYLFRREVSINLLGIPVYVDVPIINLDALPQVGYFEYSKTTWPTQWTEISVPMHFLSTGILPGQRLGLAVTVEKAGTQPAEGLEFMYDHPSFESRLQVDTNTLIGF